MHMCTCNGMRIFFKALYCQPSGFIPLISLIDRTEKFCFSFFTNIRSEAFLNASKIHSILLELHINLSKVIKLVFITLMALFSSIFPLFLAPSLIPMHSSLHYLSNSARPNQKNVIASVCIWLSHLDLPFLSADNLSSILQFIHQKKKKKKETFYSPCWFYYQPHMNGNGFF